MHSRSSQHSQTGDIALRYSTNERRGLIKVKAITGFIKDVGFPIAVSAFLMYFLLMEFLPLFRKLEYNTNAISHNMSDVKDTMNTMEQTSMRQESLLRDIKYDLNHHSGSD